MVAYQRHAVFNLCVALLSLCAFGILIPILGPAKAQGAFGLLALTAIGPLFFRKRGGQTVADERDQMIFLRATQISFGFFWLLFVGGVMMLYYLPGGSGTISRNLLPLLVWLGWIALLLCHATASLILYRRS
jgi:hypothetical protein